MSDNDDDDAIFEHKEGRRKAVAFTKKREYKKDAAGALNRGVDSNKFKTLDDTVTSKESGSSYSKEDDLETHAITLAYELLSIKHNKDGILDDEMESAAIRIGDMLSKIALNSDAASVGFGAESGKYNELRQTLEQIGRKSLEGTDAGKINCMKEGVEKVVESLRDLKDESKVTMKPK